MIPRLGDGNYAPALVIDFDNRLENDSPSRGRKPIKLFSMKYFLGLENDSPSRGRKRGNYTMQYASVYKQFRKWFPV